MENTQPAPTTKPNIDLPALPAGLTAAYLDRSAAADAPSEFFPSGSKGTPHVRQPLETHPTQHKSFSSTALYSSEQTPIPTGPSERPSSSLTQSLPTLPGVCTTGNIPDNRRFGVAPYSDMFATPLYLPSRKKSSHRRFTSVLLGGGDMVSSSNDVRLTDELYECAQRAYMIRAAAAEFSKSARPPRSRPVEWTDLFDGDLRIALGAGAHSLDSHTAVADSGATGHMVNKYVTLQHKRLANGRVRIADGGQIDIEQQGDIEVRVVDADGKDLEPLVLKDASVLKDSPFNLVSVGMLCEAGSIFHFEKGSSWFTYKGHRFPLEERDGLYLIHLDHILQAQDLSNLKTAQAAQGFDTDTFAHGDSKFACAATMDLWHQRLGHASHGRLKFLYNSGAAEGFDVTGGKHTHNASCKCTTCSAVQNEKVHIGDTRLFSDTVTQVGQCLVTDTCGPFPASIEGYRYAVSFTDVYSRFSAVYFVRNKSDAEAALESLILYYRREGFVIRELRSDAGGEFGGGNDRINVETDAEAAQDDGFVFSRVCKANNIKHIVTPTNRPELHGLAERWNKTVFKMANSMLYSSRVSHVLWPSAVAYANSIRNRLPLRGLGKFTPYELFFKRRPRLHEFRVWGCDAYVLLPSGQVPGQQNRKRLIFVGHTPDRMGFRCFDPITFRFTTHFELLFDEESSKKRINALREYDIRRELAKRGKLDDLPLLADDFNPADLTKLAAQDSERRLFAYPLPLPGVSTNLRNRGGGRGNIPNAAKESSETSTSTPPGLKGSSHGAGGDDAAQVKPGAIAEMGKEPNLCSVGATGSSSVEALADEVAVDGGASAKAYPDDNGEDDTAYIRDDDAEQFGPLTDKALKAYRKHFKFDPRNPIRPLRVLPIGRAVEECEESREFLKFAMEHNLPVKLVENPKLRGSESWKRYKRYQTAKTLREIIELSSTGRTLQRVRQQQSKAKLDIANDFLRGYILFPQNENPHPTHFVSASDIAKESGVKNIHALYSRKELQEARYKHSEQKRVKAIKLCEAYQLKGFLTFNEQISYLWDGEPPKAKLYEGEGGELTAQECAALIGQLINGDLPEPTRFKDATSESNPEHQEWRESIHRERSTLEQRGTWILVPKVLMGKHRPIRCKYVFKRKRLKNGSMQYKSRLVACGYSQVAGVNFSLDETYAGVCSYSSMRFLLSYGCQKGYLMSQVDISSAYLESYLDEDVYMVPPEDLWVDGKPPKDDQGRELVCKLQRGLYGLKQAGHLWSQCFKEFLLRDPKYQMGFTELTGDSNVYRKSFVLNGRQEEIIIGTYVDDSLILASSPEARDWLMTRMNQRFPVNPNSTGTISFEEPGLILSMNVRYDFGRGILQFDQKQSIEALATKLGLVGAAPRSLPIAPDCDLPKLKKAEVDVNEYLSIIGSCLHICQVSRPDCSFAVGVLSRHSATPGVSHREAALNLVKYLYHTRGMFIQYKRSAAGNEPEVFGKGRREGDDKDMTIEQRLVASVPKSADNSPDAYVDADYAGDTDTRRSTTGMVVMMNDGPICWQSRLQKLCAQSTAEAEIYAVVDASKEAIHIKLMCEELGIRPVGKPLRIWEDNNACIQLGHGLRGSKSAKHFEVRLRFLHERISLREIEFARISTVDQLADGFTKGLPGPAFVNFRDRVLHQG